LAAGFAGPTLVISLYSRLCMVSECSFQYHTVITYLVKKSA